MFLCAVLLRESLSFFITVDGKHLNDWNILVSQSALLESLIEYDPVSRCVS